MPIPVPDARDGLNRWSRMILRDLLKAGASSDERFLKTVKLLAPIADRDPAISVIDLYAMLLRLARPWVCRYPLIENQGNIGTLDGDPPSGMRYNEMRLTLFGEGMLAEGDPEVPCPSHFPHLLCNGAWAHSGKVTTEPTWDARSSGPGDYGPVDTVPLEQWTEGSLLSHFPPHNLREIGKALLHLIDHPQAGLDDILLHVLGPDFPTGGTVLGKPSIRALYETGAGTITLQGNATIDLGAKGRKTIDISSIPYGGTTTGILEEIAGLAKSRDLPGISDVRDLSARDKMRLQIEVRRGYDEKVLLQSLFGRTSLRRSLEFRLVGRGEDGDRPQPFMNVLRQFLNHRREMLGLRGGSNADERLKIDIKTWIEQSDPRRTQIVPG